MEPTCRDTSLVMSNDGRIVADGTHDELITSSDVYKRLYETQLIGGA